MRQKTTEFSYQFKIECEASEIKKSPLPTVWKLVVLVCYNRQRYMKILK